MIFKLSYNSQTHLYNKSISHQALTTYCSKIFRDLPHTFTFVYLSPKGEMTYIESDADLIGLKYCCSKSNDMFVKLHIVKKDRSDEFGMDDEIQTKNVVKKNLEQMAENVFERLEDETETEAVGEYLEETYNKVSQEVAHAQQQAINKHVHEYLFNLYSKTAHEVASTFVQQKPQRKRKAVRFSLERPVIHRIEKQEKSMEELVNEKVLLMLPGLVDKIYARMEVKMAGRCKKCMKKEMEMEWAIDSEINRRLGEVRVNEVVENPEDC